MAQAGEFLPGVGFLWAFEIARLQVLSHRGRKSRRGELFDAALIAEIGEGGFRVDAADSREFATVHRKDAGSGVAAMTFFRQPKEWSILLNAVADDTLTGEQEQRFVELLRSEADFRGEYVRFCQLLTQLQWKD